MIRQINTARQNKSIYNYSIAYDRSNRQPLFYEAYPGSINDVSQLQFMLEKAAAYGYKNAGFILDRGYFSEPNIRFIVISVTKKNISSPLRERMPK